MAAGIDYPEWDEVARQWIVIVGLFATQHPGRIRVDAAAYAALHGELLRACAARMTAADVELRKLLETLVDVARPWLTLGSFDLADRDILLGLWANCRDLDKELNRHQWQGALGRMRKPLLALAVMVALAFLFAMTRESTWDPLVHWTADAWVVVWSFCKRLPAIEGWLAFGTALLAAAVFVLARATRS